MAGLRVRHLLIQSLPIVLLYIYQQYKNCMSFKSLRPQTVGETAELQEQNF